MSSFIYKKQILINMLAGRKHFLLCVLLFINIHYYQANSKHKEETEIMKKKKNDGNLYKYKLYGDLDEYAYFFLDIDIGIPEQRISVILDTGSSTLSFPCSQCKSCGIHMEKPFNLNFSKTSAVLYCKKKKCPYNLRCVDGKCEYLQSYCEGSQIRGFYFLDVISLMPYNNSEKIMFKKLIGCHMHEESLFLYQQATGVLGMSVTKPYGVPTFIDLLFYSNPHIQKQFSICISDEGGELIIGGYEKSYFLNGGKNGIVHIKPELQTQTNTSSNTESDKTKENTEEQTEREKGNNNEDEEDICEKEGVCGKLGDKDKILWTNITRRFHYYIKIHGFEMYGNNFMRGKPYMEVLLDSGSTFAHIPEDIHDGLNYFFDILCIQDFNNMFEVHHNINIVNELAKKNVRYAKQLQKSLKTIIEAKNSCIKILDGIQCWKTLEGLPNIYITIDKWKMEWKPNAYLYKKESYWCKGFEKETNNKTILGLTFFKNKQIIFDLQHFQIGMVDSICPSYPFHMRPRTYNEYNENDNLFLNISFFNLYGLIILIALSLFLSVIFYVKKLFFMNFFVNADIPSNFVPEQQFLAKNKESGDNVYKKKHI